MKKKKKWKPIFVIFIVILIWQLCTISQMWSTYILPSPKSVGSAIWEMLLTGELIHHIRASLVRVFIGFFTAFLLAFFLGIIAGIKQSMEQYYEWLVSLLRHIPPLSLIPLFILWFGIGEMTKIMVIILASFFPMFLNIRKGILSCSKELLEVGQVFGFSKWEMFFKIRLPAAYPDILSGVRIGMGYSFRAIIGAEMIAASAGLGYMILDAQLFARTDKIIAGVLVIGVLGMVCDRLLGTVLYKFSKGGENYFWD